MSIFDRERGTVVKWFTERGFGFVNPDFGGAQIFVHRSELEHGVPYLQVGQAIEYSTTSGRKGPVATHVKVLA